MELYQIRYFLALSETLNFSRAAERCFVTQPALTKSIQKLEDQLGARLFDRNKSGVMLTEFGRAMLPNFQQIYHSANQTREQAKKLLREQREVIRLGVMCSIELKLFLGAIVAFNQLAAMVDVQIVEGTLEAMLDSLDKNLIDIALVASPQELPKRFEGHPLLREHYVIAHGPHHPFKGRGHIAFADLSQERYCARQNCEYSDHIDHFMQQAGFDVQVVQETHREDWIQSMVKADMGVAFMPEFSARDAGLDYVHTRDVAFERAIVAATVSNRPRTLQQEALLKQLASAAPTP